MTVVTAPPAGTSPVHASRGVRAQLRRRRRRSAAALAVVLVSLLGAALAAAALASSPDPQAPLSPPVPAAR